MNAVIYARYSSHAQNEQSIEGQLRDNYAWAQQQGITVIGEYIDRALTGTKDQRPEFLRMIRDAEKRQFQMVIVWKLDRFSRSRYDSAFYKNKLKSCGVRVVSVKENISDTPEGIILEGLLEAMAEYYSANLSQNIKRGQRESISKKQFCGGRVPIGYKIENKKIVVDEKNVENVRYIFSQYAQGVNKKKIVDELNQRGVRNSLGDKMTVNTIRTMLTNTTYIGLFRYGGETIEGMCEPIIDADTFQRVQERISRTKQAPAAAKAIVSYQLQGKAFCGHCGAPMVGECGRSNTGNVYHYYACAVKKKQHTCKKKNERKEFLETFVVAKTLQYILTSAHSTKVAKAVVAEYKKEFSSAQVDTLEKSLKQIERDLDKLVDALVEAPKVAHPRIYERMEALEAQKSEAETDLARLRIASDICITEEEVYTWLQNFRHGDPHDPDFREKIIDTFINTVYIYDNKIVIFYNIRGGSSTHRINFADLTAAHPELNSSDLIDDAPRMALKSEPYYIFVNKTLGCVVWRNRDAE